MSCGLNIIIFRLNCKVFVASDKDELIELLLSAFAANLVFTSCFRLTFAQSLLDKTKLLVHSLIQRVGFAGILLCASVSCVYIHWHILRLMGVD